MFSDDGPILSEQIIFLLEFSFLIIVSQHYHYKIKFGVKVLETRDTVDDEIKSLQLRIFGGEITFFFPLTTENTNSLS